MFVTASILTVDESGIDRYSLCPLSQGEKIDKCNRDNRHQMRTVRKRLAIISGDSFVFDSRKGCDATYGFEDVEDSCWMPFGSDELMRFPYILLLSLYRNRIVRQE